MIKIGIRVGRLTDMSGTVLLVKTVEETLSANGFGVPDIYNHSVEVGDKEDQDADWLFLAALVLEEGDGDYGEQSMRTRDMVQDTRTSC